MMIHETVLSNNDSSFYVPSKSLSLKKILLPTRNNHHDEMIESSSIYYSCKHQKKQDDDRIVKIERVIQARRKKRSSKLSSSTLSNSSSKISIIDSTSTASSSSSTSSVVTTTAADEHQDGNCKKKVADKNENDLVHQHGKKNKKDNSSSSTSLKNTKKVDTLLTNMKEYMVLHKERKEEARCKIHTAIRQTCATIVALEPKRDLNLERAKQNYYSSSMTPAVSTTSYSTLSTSTTTSTAATSMMVGGGGMNTCSGCSTEIAKRTIATYCMEQYIYYDHIIKQYMETIRNLKKLESSMDSGRITTEQIDNQIKAIVILRHQTTSKLLPSTVHQLLSQEMLFEKLENVLNNEKRIKQ